MSWLLTEELVTEPSSSRLTEMCVDQKLCLYLAQIHMPNTFHAFGQEIVSQSTWLTENMFDKNVKVNSQNGYSQYGIHWNLDPTITYFCV